MKKLSAIHIAVVIATLMFCTIKSQTYTVGDVVDNFGTTVCENGSGNWFYDVDGLGKVTWLNIFTSW